jgi:nitrilase
MPIWEGLVGKARQPPQLGRITLPYLTKFKAAAVQAAPVYLETEGTIEKACRLVGEAARSGARLVAFPEAFVPGYPYWNWIKTPLQGSEWFERLYRASVDVPGDHVSRLCAAARESAVSVVIGINERDDISLGTIYNTTLIIGADGELLGRHRKLVPT